MGVNKILPSLRKNQVISGQWEGNKYKILRQIGSGGSGSVYLVEDEAGCLKALKISADIFGINSEYRILVFLKGCSELRSLNIIPAVFEIDDCKIDSRTYYFIVMEYCQGENLGKFKGRLGLKDTAIVGRKLAVFLDCLHRTGFVFGDLKPGNVIYDFNTGQTFVVDYGSVTVKGGRLRQFTPGYDRSTWQVGARIADENYDMFSLGMLLAVLISGDIKRNRYKHSEKIIDEISGRIPSHVMREAVRKALAQSAPTCSDIVGCLSDAELKCEFSQNVFRVNDYLKSILGVTSIVGLIMIYVSQ